MGHRRRGKQREQENRENIEKKTFMATAIQLKLFHDFFFILIAATNHHSMSDEGEQPREKAAQRPSKKRRDHALGLKMFSMFSRLQCLHGSFWYESRGWS